MLFFQSYNDKPNSEGSGAMTDTNRAGLISRRDAIGLFAATPALGANVALTGVFGGTALAGAPIFGAEAASACPGASHDLSQLTVEHFESLVGNTFRVADATVSLRDIRRGPATGFRQQFAMMFEVPLGVSIASGVVPVAHPAIGRHDLFVRQMNENANRKTLEICFS
jgi:hypothetical protein